MELCLFMETFATLRHAVAILVADFTNPVYSLVRGEKNMKRV